MTTKKSSGAKSRSEQAGSPAKKAAAKTPAKKVPAKKTEMGAAKKASGTKAAKKAPATNAKKAATKSGGSKAAKTGNRAGRKYSPAASKNVEREMHEMHEGKLRIGKSGTKVTNPKQAIAIGLSEARRAGKKMPPNPNDPKKRK